MADINANKVDDMLNALNRAIEIHTDKAIQGLSYNKSELAEVVDITERNLGKYIVWNGSTRYYAYSENTTYPIGTKVYVNIPNNDFSAQKQIVGQYVTDGDPGIFYKNPLEAYEPLTPNLIEDITLGKKSKAYEDNRAELLANWNLETYPEYVKNKAPIEQMVELYRVDNMDLDTEKKYEGFKYMGISADFKTMLNTFSPIAGDYGIIVIIWGIERLDVNENAELTQKTYTLSVRDMIGNVYNYSSYFKQASLYDISEDFSRIGRIIVGFYQRGNFKDNSNHFIPVHYTLNEEPHLLKPNILVKDVCIQFGNDLTNKNDSLRIYTKNGETYDPAQKDSLNYKNIELQWTHLNSGTNEYEILKSSGDAQKNGILDFTIHWYEDAIHTNTDYIKTSDNTVDTAGNKTKLDAYNKWLKVEESETATDEEKQVARLQLIGSYGLSAPMDYTVYNGVYALTTAGASKVSNAKSNIERENYVSSSIASDILAGAGWKPLTPTGGSFVYTNFLPDYSRSYSKILCIIEYGPRLESGQYDTTSQDYFMVKSNVLQLNNLRMTSNSLSDDKANALKINCDDGTDGDYPIYNGTTGELLNREEFSRKRLFQATCFSLSTGDNYMNGNEILIWKIPRTGSMILINDTFINENELINSTQLAEITDKIEYDNKYYYIKREAKNSVAPVNNEQEYRIAQFYNKANINNTIFCYLIKNNEVFETSKSLTFSQHGTSGTDYTFSLGFTQKVNGNWKTVGPADTALTIGDKNYLEIGFDLFNSKNEKIDLTLNQKNAIIEAWTGFDQEGYYSGIKIDDNTHNNAKNLNFIHDEENGRVAVRVKPGVTDIANLRYIVLQAAVKNENVDGLKSVKFVQLLPIHIRAKDTNWVLRGSDYIIYDDKGANPSCYNDYYQLIRIDENGNDQIFKTGFTIESSGFDNDAQTKTYYPSIVPLNKENNVSVDYKLEPTPLYVNGISKEIAVCCNGGQAGVVYTCPLVILQNKYQIAAINNWNGELVVDQQGNKILASMVGAGHKNDDNTFSGVLMGDIVQKNAYTGSDEQQTGLFGYDSGAQTFGFNTDGTAFLGKSDIGRIYVDGNTGRITSAAREDYEISKDKDPRGTDINLRDNYIDIQGVGTSTGSDTNKSRIHIDANLVPTQREIQELGQTEANARHTGAYFSVHSNTGNELIHIANNSYFLQTNNYDESREEGLKIDLKEGSFNSYDTITIKGAIGSSINFGDSVSYVKLGIDNTKGSYLQMERKKEASAAEKSAITSQMDSLYNKLPSGHTATKYSYPESNYKSDISKLESKYNQDYSNYQNSAEYQNAITEYSNAKADQADLDSAYNAALAKYNNLYAQYNGSSTGIDPDEALAEWNEAKTELASAQKAYEDKNNEVTQLESTVSEKNLAVEGASTAKDNAQSTVDAANSALEQSHNAFITELTQYAVLLYGLTETTDRVFPEYGNATIHQEKSETVVNPSKDDDAIAAQKQKTDDAYSAYQQAQTDYSDALTALEQANSNLNKAQQDATEAANEYATASEELKTYKTRLDDAVVAEDKAKLVYQSSVSNKGAHDQLSSDVANAKAALDVASANKQRGEARVNTATINHNNVQNKLYGYTDSYNKGKEALSKYYDLAAKYLAITTNGGAGYIKLSNQDDIRLNIDNKFTVDKAGNLKARDANLTNATIEGTITSYNGIIGGWNISDHGLYQGDAGINAGVGSDSGNYYALWAGETNGARGQAYTNAKFKVGHNGYLHAEGAYINGEIHATSGEFTGTIHATSGDFTGTISSSTIRGSTISGNNISGGSIYGTSISGGSISGTSITGSSISGNTISGGSIYGSYISGGSIYGTSISGATISGGTINGTNIYMDGVRLTMNLLPILNYSTLQYYTLVTPNGDTVDLYAFPSKSLAYKYIGYLGWLDHYQVSFRSY